MKLKTTTGGLLAAFFLFGCSTTPIPADQAPLWKHKADITFSVGDGDFDGLGVAESIGDGVKIKISSPVKLDVLMISTCERDFELDDVGHTWLGGSSKSYTYLYTPAPIERAGFCPMYIQALTNSGAVAWGYLAFKSSEDLSGQIECNGSVVGSKGLSVCQAKSGTVQAIQFADDVTFQVSQNCRINKVSPGRFEFTAQSGFCYASFYQGVHKHRLVLLGFEDIFMRGN